MSGPFGSSQWMYSSGAGGFYPYEVEQSLRFNDDDSAYLSRTPASASNRKTWTWSGWVKRGALGAAKTILGANTTFVEFTSADKIQFDHNGTTVATSAVFRDPSAWYHVVVAVDTTQATAADRTEIYVNGTIQAVTGSYVSQNTDTDVNNATQHNIGANLTPAEYFDGYMAEVNFIDGTALDPTSFGEFKSGVWIPKKYTGSYGTNGFYLSFADSAAIGDDLSGNGNDWTPSGLASTDVLLDSPTNNYCTFNPLNLRVGGLEDGNLLLRNGGVGSSAGTTFRTTSGKWYAEFTMNQISAGITITHIGVGDRAAVVDFSVGPFKFYRQDGVTDATSGLASFSNGDVIGVAVNADDAEVSWYHNGVFQATSTGANYSEFHIFAMISSGAGDSLTANFGQSPFTYTPPAGFLALNTANLPEPTITPARDDVPADYFNTVLWTGDGVSPSSITGVGFQPDLLWTKARSAAYDGLITDAVRGAGRSLTPSSTGAEALNNGNGYHSSFDTDGFTLTQGASSIVSVNESGQTYVAWNWKANGAGVANTDGTISSTVSANTKAGFSVVGYTGTGANATVGHGLGAVPKMVIVKNRDQADAWQVYHGANTANPETDYLVLNTTAATADAADRWNDTLPTSSVFSLGNGATVNTSSEDYIAYCFAEVEGFSKFGSYTGNGAADGPFVYCGFRPAFVMIKSTNITANWVIIDNNRNTYNPSGKWLLPDTSNTEFNYDALYPLDFLSNGFKIKSSVGTLNTSAGTYIFAAFAEQPVKYANAR